MIIALALLPAHLIPEALLYIEQLAYALGAIQGTLRKWQKFFAYFRKEWIKTVTPRKFSVFDSLNRTNNCLERYHRDLNQFMIYHPSVKTFIRKKLLEFYHFYFFFFVNFKYINLLPST